MEFKNPISIKELTELFENESTLPFAIEHYTIYDDSKPFSGEYLLKPGIVIVDHKNKDAEKGLEGSIRNNIVDRAMTKANNREEKRRNKIYEKVKEDTNRIKIVAEGDSWFQYPRFKLAKLVPLNKEVKEILDYLIDNEKYAVKSLAAAGDILRNMYHSRDYMRLLREEKPQLLLLSAGGNDFFAVFGQLLKKNKDKNNVAGWLGVNFTTEMDVLHKYYTELLKEIVSEFPKLQIIIHGYDYVMPNIDQKWLGKPMINKGVTKKADRSHLIKMIMDQFNEKLSELAENSDLKNNVHYLNLRGTVPQDKAYWHDEIHPNSKGFEKIAKKFDKKIDDVLKSKHHA